MLKYDNLDYFKLIKEATNPGEHLGFKKTLRVAVLAEFASQQLTPLLKILAQKSGYNLELYAEYTDQLELEAFNPSSKLYEFSPDFILLMPTTEKLKSEIHLQAPLSEMNLEKIILRFKNIWAALRANSEAVIIQSNFVVPFERVFGNFDNLVEESFTQLVANVNLQLALEARRFGSVLINDVEYLASYTGKRNWLDERLWYLAKIPCALAYLPLLAQNIIDIVLSAAGENIKCVVLDLDNTLWGGTIGDDGVDGIQIGDLGGEAFVSFQRFLLALKQRGILLAVCSKNDHANAIKPFTEHPQMVLREADISCFVANWENKADNIRLIQKTLNVSSDSMVFLDDSAFERNLVRELLPQVVVPELSDDPALYLRSICELNLFEATSFSSTDSNRTELYRIENLRESAKPQFSTIQDYLRALDMTARVEPFKEFTLPRIIQLLQRSNQFNLTTKRFSQSQLETFLKNDTAYFPFSVSLKDKYGDYGLVAAVVLKRNGEWLEIEECVMSCRVLHRGVESLMMNTIFSKAKELGIQYVRGKYIRSEKNGMVAGFYGLHGFTKTSKLPNGETSWICETDQYNPTENFLNLKN